MKLSRIGIGSAAVLALTMPFASPGEAAAPTQAADLLYVCVQDDAKIAVVDMSERKVVRTIDLRAYGFSATAKPHFIAVEPDGRHWYVSLIGENRVLKFDQRDSIVGQFETEVPGMLYLAPDGSKLAVSRSMSAVNPPPRIALVDRASMRGDDVDVLFPRPHPMVVAANGYAYTASLGVNRLAAIELATERVTLTSVPGPTHSFVQFALSPDGRTLVSSSEISGRLLVFSLTDPATPSLVKSIDVGKMAFDPAFTPDGREVYVPVKSTNQIVVLETAGWTEVARIEHADFHEPHQVVFSPDGATAFVTNNRKMDHMADPAMAGHEAHAKEAGDGTASLVVIDVKNRRVTASIPLGRNLTGMGRRPSR